MYRTIRLAVFALGVFAVGSVAAQEGQEGQEPQEASASDAGTDSAQDPETTDPTAPTGSVSVGMTNRGRVLHSVELEDAETLRVKRGSEDARWGTAEMVSMIVTAAEAVAAAHPGSRLNVGDISRQGGGRTRPHRSHRAGRDVDLGFYLRDTERDEEVQSDRFVSLTRSGRGRNRGHSYSFDVIRNWALMRSLLENPGVAVQYVLVTPSLRRILLRHARETGADSELIQRFGEVSARRSGSASHRSHFHVRIYCSNGDRPRCVNAPPFHPWVFTTAAQVEKATREYREFRPPRRARSRRSRRRGRMRRRGMMRRSMAMGSTRSMASRSMTSRTMASRSMASQTRASRTMDGRAPMGDATSP